MHLIRKHAAKLRDCNKYENDSGYLHHDSRLGDLCMRPSPNYLLRQCPPDRQYLRHSGCITAQEFYLIKTLLRKLTSELAEMSLRTIMKRTIQKDWA